MGTALQSNISALDRPTFSDFRIRWMVLFAYLIIHAGVAAAPWFFSYQAFWTAVVLWTLTGMIGISAGYHRLLAHRTFNTYRWIKRLHATLGALSLQLGPITWVRLHRIHHAKSDTIEDPHPQQYGFFFGHMGWSFLSHSKIARSSLSKLEITDVSSDPYLIFLDKYFLHLVGASLLLLYIVGGLPFLLWAGFVRIAFLLHTTWMVNSVCHRWGRRTFDTPDTSVNQPALAIFTWGESWHNNHHRFSNSARFGLHWYQIDFAWLWIKFLKAVGLAWDIKTPANYAPPAEGPSFKSGGTHGRKQR